MMYASTRPAMRYNRSEHALNAFERFLQTAEHTQRQSNAQYKFDGSAYHLTLDVPGIAKDQLVIAIEGAVVRITSREDAPRHYRAAYEFPQEIDPIQSEAKLENGVLQLKLSAKIPAKNSTEITIQ